MTKIMPLRRTSVVISGVRVDLCDSPEFYRFFDDAVSRDLRGLSVFFVNAHCVNVAQRDRAYRDSLGRASLVLNDGAGVALAARMQGVVFTENMCGTDVVPRLLIRAAERGARVFLLGGQAGVAEAAARNLQRDMPSLRIVGSHPGYFAERENEGLVRRIRALDVDILLVGMGVPTQEMWIDAHARRSGARLALAVGAFMDFASGRMPRAPAWMRRLGLEWLYRLSVEPRRLFRRYVVGIPVFLFRVLRPTRAGRARAGHSPSGGDT